MFSESVLENPRLVSGREGPEEDITGMDLQDFLDFLNFCEANANEYEKKFVDQFVNLVSNLDRCAISGSCVLNHRLGNVKKSGDIDLFIEDTLINRSDVSHFFDVCSDRLLPKFSKKFINKITSKGGIYKQTFNNDYSLFKLDHELTLYRFGFDGIFPKEFNLNFVFLKKISDSDKKSMRLPVNVSGKLFSRYFLHPKFKGLFLGFSNGGKVMDDEYDEAFKIYPKAESLHMIEDSFDFEELKYVYSFELQQAITTKMAGKLLILDFGKKIKSLLNDGVISVVAQKLIFDKVKLAVAKLDSENTEFIKNFSNKELLHITNGILFEDDMREIKSTNSTQYTFYDINEIFNQISKDALSRLVARITLAIRYLSDRIEKYEKYGFKIKDIDMVIANLQQFMSLFNTWALSHSSLNRIALESTLMSGAKETLYKVKYLRLAHKQSKELIDANNLSLDADGIIEPSNGTEQNQF